MPPAAHTGCLVGFGFALTAAAVTAVPAHAGDDFAPAIDFKGLIDFRGVIASSTQSWENGGLGKTRYGGTAAGDRRVLGTIGEATLIAEPRLGWDVSGYIQITAAPEQHVSPDLIEAYVQYKPAPSGAWSYRVRAGVFFPPISQENTALGWTSPYTISSSAINTWVGEEVRNLGGELTILHHSDSTEISLTGATVAMNDPAGTLLAWRGWTISDRKAGLFERLNLPALPSISPRGGLAKQQPYDQPFKEIDGRLGYYLAGKIGLLDYGSVSVMRYDNRADDKLFENGQWPWHTRFWSVGADLHLANIDVLAQTMTGRTTLVTLPQPIGPLVYSDFKAAYGLISRAWGNHRLSLRYDWFKTDGDDLFDDADEHGNALTFAYIYRPNRHQRLTFEALYIDSHHSERVLFGLPERAKETQFQISYRFFL